MAIYADYAFYTTEYLCGKEAAVTEASFPYYARKASAEIDRYTFGSVPENIPEEVRLCCCELSEIMSRESAAHTARTSGVTSESVGGWSVSYESADARNSAHRVAVRDCIREWLSGTGLLFSGVS